MPQRKVHVIPPVGTKFERDYKREKYILEVVSKGGMIRFKVGKHLFASPSGAAKAIVNQEVNGWRFWGMIE